MRYLLALALLCAMGQEVITISHKPAAAGGTWTTVQHVFDRAVWTNHYTCAALVCTLTVPSTGSGNGLIIVTYETNGVAAPTVTGGCTSWVNQSTGHVTSGPVGSLSASTCVSSNSGTTSIVVTYGATQGDPAVFYVEGSWSGSSISFDTANTRTQASGANPAGATLTLTGTSDLIMQICSSGGARATAATSPYDTNFSNNNDVPDSLGFSAGSWVINSSSGTAPTWTATTDAFLLDGVALKGN